MLYLCCAEKDQETEETQPKTFKPVSQGPVQRPDLQDSVTEGSKRGRSDRRSETKTRVRPGSDLKHETKATQGKDQAHEPEPSLSRTGFSLKTDIWRSEMYPPGQDEKRSETTTNLENHSYEFIKTADRCSSEAAGGQSKEPEEFTGGVRTRMIERVQPGGENQVVRPQKHVSAAAKHKPQKLNQVSVLERVPQQEPSQTGSQFKQAAEISPESGRVQIKAQKMSQIKEKPEKLCRFVEVSTSEDPNQNTRQAKEAHHTDEAIKSETITSVQKTPAEDEERVDDDVRPRENSLDVSLQKLKRSSEFVSKEKVVDRETSDPPPAEPKHPKVHADSSLKVSHLKGSKTKQTQAELKAAPTGMKEETPSDVPHAEWPKISPEFSDDRRQKMVPTKADLDKQALLKTVLFQDESVTAEKDSSADDQTRIAENTRGAQLLMVEQDQISISATRDNLRHSSEKKIRPAQEQAEVQCSPEPTKESAAFGVEIRETGVTVEGLTSLNDDIRDTAKNMESKTIRGKDKTQKVTPAEDKEHNEDKDSGSSMKKKPEFLRPSDETLKDRRAAPPEKQYQIKVSDIYHLMDNQAQEHLQRSCEVSLPEGRTSEDLQSLPQTGNLTGELQFFLVPVPDQEPHIIPAETKQEPDKLKSFADPKENRTEEELGPHQTDKHPSFTPFEATTISAEEQNKCQHPDPPQEVRSSGDKHRDRKQAAGKYFRQNQAQTEPRTQKTLKQAKGKCPKEGGLTWKKISSDWDEAEEDKETSDVSQTRVGPEPAEVTSEVNIKYTTFDELSPNETQKMILGNRVKETKVETEKFSSLVSTGLEEEKVTVTPLLDNAPTMEIQTKADKYVFIETPQRRASPDARGILNIQQVTTKPIQNIWSAEKPEKTHLSRKTSGSTKELTHPVNVTQDVSLIVQTKCPPTGDTKVTQEIQMKSVIVSDTINETDSPKTRHEPQQQSFHKTSQISQDASTKKQKPPIQELLKHERVTPCDVFLMTEKQLQLLKSQDNLEPLVGDVLETTKPFLPPEESKRWSQQRETKTKDGDNQSDESRELKTQMVDKDVKVPQQEIRSRTIRVSDKQKIGVRCSAGAVMEVATQTSQIVLDVPTKLQKVRHFITSEMAETPCDVSVMSKEQLKYKTLGQVMSTETKAKAPEPDGLKSQNQLEPGGLKSQNQLQLDGLKPQNQLEPGGFKSQNEVEPGELQSQNQLEPGCLKSQNQLEPDGLKSQNQLKPGGLKSQNQVEPDGLISKNQLQPDRLKSQIQLEPGELKSQSQLEPGDFKSQNQLELDGLKSRNLLEPEVLKSQNQLEPGGLKSQNQLELDGLKSRNLLEPEVLKSQNQLEQGVVQSQRHLEPGDIKSQIVLEPGGVKSQNQLQPGGVKSQNQLEPDGLTSLNLSEPGGLKSQNQLQPGGLKSQNQSETGGLKSLNQLEPDGLKAQNQLEQGGVQSQGQLEPGGLKCQNQLQLDGLKSPNQLQPGGGKFQSQLKPGGGKSQILLEPGGVKSHSELEPGGIKSHSQLELGGLTSQSQLQPGSLKSQNQQQPQGVKFQSQLKPGGGKSQILLEPGGVKSQSQMKPGDIKSHSQLELRDVTSQSQLQPGGLKSQNQLEPDGLKSQNLSEPGGLKSPNQLELGGLKSQNQSETGGLKSQKQIEPGGLMSQEPLEQLFGDVLDTAERFLSPVSKCSSQQRQTKTKDRNNQSKESPELNSQKVVKDVKVPPKEARSRTISISDNYSEICMIVPETKQEVGMRCSAGAPMEVASEASHIVLDVPTNLQRVQHFITSVMTETSFDVPLMSKEPLKDGILGQVISSETKAKISETGVFKSQDQLEPIVGDIPEAAKPFLPPEESKCWSQQRESKTKDRDNHSDESRELKRQIVDKDVKVPQQEVWSRTHGVSDNYGQISLIVPETKQEAGLRCPAGAVIEVASETSHIVLDIPTKLQRVQQFITSETTKTPCDVSVMSKESLQDGTLGQVILRETKAKTSELMLQDKLEPGGLKSQDQLEPGGLKSQDKLEPGGLKSQDQLEPCGLKSQDKLEPGGLKSQDKLEPGGLKSQDKLEPGGLKSQDKLEPGGLKSKDKLEPGGLKSQDKLEPGGLKSQDKLEPGGLKSKDKLEPGGLKSQDKLEPGGLKSQDKLEPGGPKSKDLVEPIVGEVLETAKQFLPLEESKCWSQQTESKTKDRDKHLDEPRDLKTQIVDKDEKVPQQEVMSKTINVSDNYGRISMILPKTKQEVCVRCSAGPVMTVAPQNHLITKEVDLKSDSVKRFRAADELVEVQTAGNKLYESVSPESIEASAQALKDGTQVNRIKRDNSPISEEGKSSWRKSDGQVEHFQSKTTTGKGNLNQVSRQEKIKETALKTSVTAVVDTTPSTAYKLVYHNESNVETSRNSDIPAKPLEFLQGLETSDLTLQAQNNTSSSTDGPATGTETKTKNAVTSAATSGTEGSFKESDHISETFTKNTQVLKQDAEANVDAAGVKELIKGQQFINPTNELHRFQKTARLNYEPKVSEPSVTDLTKTRTTSYTTEPSPSTNRKQEWTEVAEDQNVQSIVETCRGTAVKWSLSTFLI
ncbi:microtubule-associated protein futsch-like [Nothobranchius furzeri]|uniref:microtubule-associated protein futsch-like n=1 Tax=Nothobranchius furzeri TaxID=105023 RepID=UPI0039047B6B